MKKSSIIYSVFSWLFCFIPAHQAHSAGFAIIEHSVSGLGNSFAGGTTIAEDPTTVFFNPAGLSKLTGTQMTAGMHLILPRAKFKSEGSTQTLPPALGGTTIPLGGGDGGDGGRDALVPNFYFTTPIVDKLRFGFGVNAPFGLITEYGEGWEGRYHALRSDLKTVNINPSLAFAFNEKFSVGVGFNAQYIRATLTNAIDFGTIGAGIGLTPQNADGKVKINASDWSVGYNLGFLYEPIQGTRIGFAFRSKISHTLRGNARFRVPTAALPLTAGGSFTNTSATAQVDLPETVSLGFLQKINNEFEIMGDVSWTHWNRFKTLTINFGNPNQPTSIQPEEWENTLRYSLGVNYHVNDEWTLRLGAAYDEEPIPGADLRTPRIPGNDRRWVSIGASYRGFDNLTFDVAYAHLFIKDPDINAVDSVGLAQTLRGHYETDVNIVSAQLNLVF